MKRATKTNTSVTAGNVAGLSRLTDQSPEREVILGFVRLLCEVADAIAAGDQVYVTIGANRTRTAYIITLNDGASKTYAGGQTMLAAMDEAVRTL